MKNEIKIAVLETKLDTITDIINEIKNNHLDHIYKRMNNLEKKFAYYIGGLAVLMIIIELFGSFFLKLLV